MRDIQIMWAFVQAFAHQQSSKIRNERGASTLELVIIAGGIAAIAIAVLGIIRGVVTGKASSIPTE